MSLATDLRRTRQGLAERCESTLWGQSDAESRDAVAEAAALLDTAYALYLKTLLDLDSRQDAVPGARPGKVAATYARDQLRRSRATADVAAARALDADLPQLGAALAAGEVSREHVGTAVRTLQRIPARVREKRSEEIDGWFVGTSRDLPPVQSDRLAGHLLEVLDPDGSDTFDPDAIDRRELSVTRDSTGMVLIRGQFEANSASHLLAALDHLSKPWPREKDDEDALPIPDERSKGQRNADALLLMGRLALGAMGTGAEIDRPRVSIHAPLHGPVAECDQTGVVTKPWLQQFLCDAVLEAAMVGRTGEVLNLGYSVRTATAHQRRALIARDGGCVIPGCHAPGAWCDSHHVRWWSKGGRTDVANMALLCTRHHADVHSGRWELEMRDGLPWARPPTWVDPAQKLIRNTYRDHRDRAHQLRLDLEPQDPDDLAA